MTMPPDAARKLAEQAGQAREQAVRLLKPVDRQAIEREIVNVLRDASKPPRLTRDAR